MPSGCQVMEQDSLRINENADENDHANEDDHENRNGYTLRGTRQIESDFEATESARINCVQGRMRVPVNAGIPLLACTTRGACMAAGRGVPLPRGGTAPCGQTRLTDRALVRWLVGPSILPASPPPRTRIPTRPSHITCRLLFVQHQKNHHHYHHSSHYNP